MNPVNYLTASKDDDADVRRASADTIRRALGQGKIFAPFVDRYDATAVWPEGIPFPVVIKDGESRLAIESYAAPSYFIKKVVGLTIQKPKDVDGIFVYGVRALSQISEDDYTLRGTVSIEGRKHRAFTSSRLFLVEGKLVVVSVLYASKLA